MKIESGLQQDNFCQTYVATDCVSNSSVYCLINSLAFHPAENIFCATFSGRNMIVFYRIDINGIARVVQKICGPNTSLSSPQHIVFSRDGERIIVSNWSSETLTIHGRLRDGSYSVVPLSVTPFLDRNTGYKPHGMDISRSGKFVATAFGASDSKPKAIAIYSYERPVDKLVLLSLVEGNDLPGIPKGICFSPDESHLIVTFSDVNCVCIYELDADMVVILKSGCQTLRGPAAGLDRPEDVKLSHGDHQLIVSNSGNNSVSFYGFDAIKSRIETITPEFVMENGSFSLEFPHGLAVSPDGCYLTVSQFGPLPLTTDHDIAFGRATPTRQAKIWIFKRYARGYGSDLPRNWRWNALYWKLLDRIAQRS
jgi:6-phosphogluconolactonase (cycloisomerase 2 family)